MASKTQLGRMIDRFIASTHPRAPLAGKGDMLVRAASKYGVDPRLLAVIARKESQFGTKGTWVRGHNAWGWGVKLGPDVYTAPSWEVMAERVAKGLSGNLYKGAGLTTAAQILPKYAPPFENNTAQYISQVNSWMRQMGANPNASVFGQPSMSAATTPGGSTAEQYATVTQMVPGQIDKDRLMMLLRNQRQRSLRGIMPAEGFRGELAKLAQSALPRAQTVVATQAVGNQAQQAAAPISQMPKWTIGGNPYAGTHTIGNWQSDLAHDLMGKTGDPVFAGVDGVVEKISGSPGGNPRFAGYGITVRTPRGRVFYKHLGSSRVKVGQRVSRNSLIGTLDGAVQGGPHLHLGAENRGLLDFLRSFYMGGR